MKLEQIDTQIEKTIDSNFELVIVHSDASMTIAKNNSKSIGLKKTEYEDSVEPFKKFAHGLHKKIVATEKENILVFDKAISKQKEEISVYKEKLYAIQQETLRIAQKIADKEADELKAKHVVIAEEASDKLLVEAERLQDTGASDERIEKKLDESDRIKTSVAFFNPEAIPEKIIAKKNIVKEKITYFISDEQAFIEWALMNNRSLLKIEPSLSMFNIWVRNHRKPENKFSFVEKSISY